MLGAPPVSKATQWRSLASSLHECQSKGRRGKFTWPFAHPLHPWSDSGVSFYLGLDFLLSQLQPGLTKKTATAFELPDDAFAGPLKLVIPEKGSIFKKKGHAVVELVKPGLAKAQSAAPKITEKQAASQTEQPEQGRRETLSDAECHRSRKKGRRSLRLPACRSVVREEKRNEEGT